MKNLKFVWAPQKKNCWSMFIVCPTEAFCIEIWYCHFYGILLFCTFLIVELQKDENLFFFIKPLVFVFLFIYIIYSYLKPGIVVFRKLQSDAFVRLRTSATILLFPLVNHPRTLKTIFLFLWKKLNKLYFLVTDIPISMENCKIYVNDSFWNKRKFTIFCIDSAYL